MKPSRWQVVARAAAIGLAAGLLIALLEIARLTWLVRGSSFPATLLFDAAAVDGGLGALIGAAAGVMLSLVWPRSHRAAARPPTVSSGASMSRRTFLRAAGTGAIVAGAFGGGALAWAGSRRLSSSATLAAIAPSGVPVPSSAPNVLLITIDTLRADQLGVYGHPYMRTPALDAFALQGARFDWHMVQQPQTNPSHASMFTGMYPASSGVRVHMVDQVSDELQTLAKLFAAAGFATAGLYSWMSFDTQYCNFEPGFQTYQDLTSAGSSLLNAPGIRRLVAQYRVAEQYLSAPRAFNHVTGLQQQQESEAKGHADVTTAAAISQLSAFHGQPFFMWLHYYDPHYPFQPPGSYRDLYDPGYSGVLDESMTTIEAIQQGRLDPEGADLQRLISLYQGEITYLDSQIALLFEHLDSLGLSDNTVVALTGDHGESFGEHTQLDEDGAFFHPRSLYNTEQRVPLLLRYPPLIGPGTTVSSPTQAIDLFPSLLELAGLDSPAQAQGRSLVPLLDGSDGGGSRVAFAAMADYVFTSLTVPGWKLIQNNANGQQALFDLDSDPQEQQDLFQDRADIAGDLSGRLQRWMDEVHIS